MGIITLSMGFWGFKCKNEYKSLSTVAHRKAFDNRTFHEFVGDDALIVLFGGWAGPPVL